MRLMWEAEVDSVANVFSFRKDEVIWDNLLRVSFSCMIYPLRGRA